MSYHDVSRATVIYMIICDLYNSNHAKYGLTFCDEEAQRNIYHTVVKNLNKINPLESEHFSVDVSRVPSDRDPDWTTIPIRDLDTTDFPFRLPEIQPAELSTIISFTGGIL